MKQLKRCGGGVTKRQDIKIKKRGVGNKEGNSREGKGGGEKAGES